MDAFSEESLITFLTEHPDSPTLKIAKHFYGEEGKAKDVNWLLHDMRNEGKLAKSGKSSDERPGPPTWRIATETDRTQAKERQDAKDKAIAAKKLERSKIVEEKRLERSKIVAEKRLEKSLAPSTKVKGGKRGRKNLDSSPSNSRISDSGLLRDPATASELLSPKRSLNMSEFVSNKNERDRLVKEITDRVHAMSLGDLRELSSALDS